MKELVPAELRPLSWPKFTSLIYAYIKNPEVGIKLGKHVDIDYLHTLGYDEREYMADFLFVWYREYLDSNSKRRDIYANYDLSRNVLEDTANNPESCMDVADTFTEPKVIKMWDRKLINSYTIRDYMPSRMFNEDKIIQYVDYVNAKKKGK